MQNVCAKPKPEKHTILFYHLIILLTPNQH